MWNSQQKNIRFVQDSGFVWGNLFFDVQARGMDLYLKTRWFNTTRSVSISSLGQGSLVCFWGVFFQLGQTPVSHVVFWRWFLQDLPSGVIKDIVPSILCSKMIGWHVLLLISSLRAYEMPFGSFGCLTLKCLVVLIHELVTMCNF